MSVQRYNGQALVDWITEDGKHPLPDMSSCTCKLVCIDDDGCPLHGMDASRAEVTR